MPAAPLADMVDADGVVASDRLTAKLRISKLELAVALGLSRDAVLEDPRG